MAIARGYAFMTAPDAQIWERDTITCGHCSRVVYVKPGTATTVYLLPHSDGRWTEEAGAFCRSCMKPVCLACHDVGTCLPLEKWLAQQEARVQAPRIVLG